MKNAYSVVIQVLVTSCTLINTDDTINLGGKYRYIQEYPQAIIYQPSEEHNGTGPFIVEPVVRAYKFNDRYIFAKSQEFDNLMNRDSALVKPYSYWIVDKKDTMTSVQPMDSVNFYKKLKALRVNLTF